MQIHVAQCAKYRPFQEGYSMTPQMHSYHISCQARIFYFLFFKDCWQFIVLLRLNESWVSLLDVTGKAIFSISSIHLSIFF